jgi:hypothetical protein
MRYVILLCLFAVGMAFGGETKPPAGPKLNRKVDKQAAEMDYGPFLHMHCGDGGSNIAFKGIVIPLNKERTANICFDTELLRVSHAWTGAWLALAGRQFADNNNDYPLLDGTIQFATGITPGWAVGDKRDDPRTSQPGVPKDGHLPSDWGRYTGLYVDGENVVLSYRVADCAMLEAFELGPVADGKSIQRVLNVAPSKQTLSLLLMEGEKAGDGSAIDQPAGLGLELSASETRNYLVIPPHDRPLRIAAAMACDQNHAWKIQAAFLKEDDLAKFTKGGPARYPQILETKGEVSAVTDQPYVVDTLTAPADNPWKAWLRFTGLDFFKDGRAALCTWNGDVWVVSGIDEKLESLKWKRYATGLHGPMGVKIVDDVVYVSCKDQITRLHDLNGDGEADFYENFNNDCYATTNFHEYCFDLQTDSAGNFYFAKGSAIWAGSKRMTEHNGRVCKVSKDGTQFEALCSGLRAPNGLSVGPNDEIICADNQGNWTPLCPLNFIEKGKYYGFVGEGQQPKERERPICWIPYAMDKSTAGQIWVKDSRWGPFKDNLIAVSYDCAVEKVFLEKVGDRWQGGIVKFPLKFPSGLMRARFNPVDGQLYSCGLRGWSSRAAIDHVFTRVRYTGKPVRMPLSVKTRKGGLDITFTTDLDPASAGDTQNVGAEWYMLKRSGNYGSGEFMVSDPEKKGKEVLEIAAMKLLPDHRTLSLDIPALKPVDVIILKFNLKAADGAEFSDTLSYTINAIPE